MQYRQDYLYKIWVILSATLVALILIVGGFTRLTNSGLSIVEWKPITGILPPLNEQDWHNEKLKYELSPEYKFVNPDITIEQFKKIYLIEYFHRLIARITGIIFLIPFLYFFITGFPQLEDPQHYKRHQPFRVPARILCVFFLGILQAFFGWYMVKSGLVNEPHVSHYRLALHFCTAITMFCLLWYEFYQPKFSLKNKTALTAIKVLIFFTFIQCVLGAFVAGLKAGMLYNTFPLIEEELIPKDLFNLQISELFSSCLFIQFAHRMNGFFILLISTICIIHARLKVKSLLFNTVALTALIIMQILLGVLVLIYQLPIIPSILHQGLVIIILSMELVIYKKLA